MTIGLGKFSVQRAFLVGQNKAAGCCVDCYSEQCFWGQPVEVGEGHLAYSEQVTRVGEKIGFQ